MFDSGRKVVWFSILMAFIIFGCILEGFIIHDQVKMTLDNWQSIIGLRFLLHTIGILPFWLVFGIIMKSKWKVILLGLVNLALMNINPIYDLIEGPLLVEHPSPDVYSREVYNNPSSDFDFSTRDEPMIRIAQDKRSMMVTKDSWDQLVERCEGQILVNFVGLKNLEVVLDCRCE